MRHSNLRVFHRGLDQIGIVPAQLYGAPPLDHHREEIACGLSLGDRTVERPLELNTPVLTSAQSEHLMSVEHRKGFIAGAGAAKTAVNCGWLGILTREKELAVTAGAKVMTELSPARFGANAETIGLADALILSLVYGGSGSKDGSGSGVIVPDEIAPELAESSGLTGSGPILSPVRLLDMDTPRDLGKLVQLGREVTGHEIPVLVKIAPGRVFNDLRIAVAAKPDGIIVDCTNELPEGRDIGPGDSKTIGSPAGHMGLPGIGILPLLKLALDESKADAADVKVLVQADLRSGADVFKVMAFGVSGVMVNTTAMAPSAESASKIKAGTMAENLGEFLKGLHTDLRAITAWTGHDSITKIETADLRALKYNIAAITGLKLLGYDKPLTMWEH